MFSIEIRFFSCHNKISIGVIFDAKGRAARFLRKVSESKGMIKVDLNGKVAVITSAGNALGNAIAKALAANGAVIAACDSDLEKAEKTAQELVNAGAKAKAYCVDVMQHETLMGICEQIEKDLGGIDILVNNEKDTVPAGERKLLHEMDMDRYYEITNRELMGLYYMTKAGIQGMAHRKQGVVVNITSTLGLVPRKGMIANVAAATATISLTRVWALEMTPDHVRMHTIARGPLPEETDITEDEIEHLAVQRTLTPDDVANAVLYAVSDEAEYENGGVITVDGGLHYGYMRNF